MNLIVLEHCEIEFNARMFCTCSAARDQELSVRPRAGRPKLNVVTRRSRPVCAGITNQPNLSRLRVGSTADGRTGYYGVSKDPR